MKRFQCCVEAENGVFGHGEVDRGAGAVAVGFHGGDEGPASRVGDSAGGLGPVRVGFMGCYVAKAREAVDEPLLFIYLVKTVLI